MPEQALFESGVVTVKAKSGYKKITVTIEHGGKTNAIVFRPSPKHDNDFDYYIRSLDLPTLVPMFADKDKVVLIDDDAHTLVEVNAKKDGLFLRVEDWTYYDGITLKPKRLIAETFKL